MKIEFLPPAHDGCCHPNVVKCDADVREWVSLKPGATINPIWLDVDNGFCDNYPAGTKQCISVQIDLIRKYGRYKHRATYITLPNGDEL